MSNVRLGVVYGNLQSILSASQRDMVSAKIANMPFGGTGENQYSEKRGAQNCAPLPVSQREAATIVGGSKRGVQTSTNKEQMAQLSHLLKH